MSNIQTHILYKDTDKEYVYEVGAHETCIVFDMYMNGQSIDRSVRIKLNGEHAEGRIYSVFMGNSDQRFTISHQIEHAAPHTISELTTAGVLSEKARTSYDACIRMNENAHKAEGHQKEHTLLLSRDAHVNAVPHLEIAHNDVKCSHAVSTTHIDKEKLFFMNARGIETHVAIDALVRGHVMPIIDNIEDVKVREELIKAVENAV